MSEHVLKINTRTGEVLDLGGWPEDGSAGAEAHYLNLEETSGEVMYRTCPSHRVEQIRAEFAQIAKKDAA